MSWTIRLYGCDNNTGATDEIEDKTVIEALTDVGYIEYTNILGMYPTIEFEGKSVEYVNGFTTTLSKIRGKYSITLYPQEFPTSGTTLESYYGVNVLNKEYKWLWFNDYVIYPDGITSTKVLAIAITGLTVDHIDSGGTTYKQITIQCQNRGLS